MIPKTVLAPAKLNLSLRVLAREASGFHQIETLFCALELADELEITTGGEGIRLEVLASPEQVGPPPNLGPPEHNLARRAAEAFFDQAGLPRAATIRLTKRVPAGAGLGGGSSDAAAVLRALNELHDRPLDQRRLLETGAGLGSDVPFFLTGAPMALAWGRGGRLLPVMPPPARAVLLGVPGEQVSTAEAYALLARRRGATFAAPPALLATHFDDWNDVAAFACNDFESVIFEQLPALARLRLALLESGAALARMTGTGSVVFGIFADSASAEAAAGVLSGQFADVRFILTGTASAAARTP